MNISTNIRAAKHVLAPRLQPVRMALMWARYLLVPLLAAMVASGLAFCAAFGIGPSSMLLGAYDGSPQQIIPLAVTAMLLAFALYDISKVILKYGPDRFNLDKDDIILNPWWRRFGRVFLGLLYASVPFFTLLACQKAAELPWWGWLIWAVAAVLMGWAYYWFQGNAVIIWLLRRLPDFDLIKETNAAGYRFSETTPGLGYGHRRQMLLFGVCLAYGLLLYALPHDEPAAALYVLLIIMGVTWGCSALGFFLGRHHIPLLLALVIWSVLMNSVSHKDYTYKVVEAPADFSLPSGYDILKANPERRIAVAAVGGGIHSGAWAVEVLTRLQEIEGCRDLPKKICLLSGTSGGSYGAMHYAHAIYHDPAMKLAPGAAVITESEKHYLDIVRQATRASSLGTIVRAMGYHDLSSYLLPIPHLTDRGNAMERQWAANSKAGYHPNLDSKLGAIVPGRDEDLSRVTMRTWAVEALEGRLPAILFTSGTEESGRPALYGNTAVWDWNWNAPRPSDISDGCACSRKNYTVPVVTGARLSASFPFVSPAARPDAPDKTLCRVEHQMDGGYYDNHGLVALNRWLQEALSSFDNDRKNGKPLPPLDFLVIQIRYKETPSSKEPPKSGLLYQLGAPLNGLYQAKGTGQRLRADEQFDIFTKYWNEKHKDQGNETPLIRNAVFEFESPRGEEPPLSWHLTESQKNDLSTVGQRIIIEYRNYKPQREFCNKLPEGPEKKKQLDALRNRYPNGAAAYEVIDFINKPNTTAPPENSGTGK
jgi:hypothetical protein